MVKYNEGQKVIKLSQFGAFHKVKFQNLGENGAECFFTWETKSGSFIPEQVIETEDMPWD